MKSLHLFFVFLRQSLNIKLLFCVLFTVLVMSGSIAGLIDPNVSVWYLLDKSMIGSGAVSLLICVIPMIPFASSLAEEYETNMLRYYTVRTGTKTYLVNKLAASFLSGFTTMFLSQLLFILVFVCFFPLFNKPDADFAYVKLMSDGHVLKGFTMFMIHMSLSGALMAVTAVLVSTIVPNPFAAISVPAIVYFTLSRIAPATANIPRFLIPSYLIEYPSGIKDPYMELLAKFLTVMVLSVIALFFGMAGLKRRIADA